MISTSQIPDDYSQSPFYSSCIGKCFQRVFTIPLSMGYKIRFIDMCLLGSSFLTFMKIGTCFLPVMEEVIHENQPVLLDPSSPGLHSSKQISEEAKVCSPTARAVILLYVILL